VIITLGWAIALTGCRGAVSAYLLALLIMFAKMIRERLLIAVVVMSALGAVAMSYSAQWAEWLPHRLFMGDTDSVHDISSGRFSLWGHALDLIEMRPIFGGGADSYVALSGEGVHAHNVFLSVLAELGIVGGLLFARVLFKLVSDYLNSEVPGWARWSGFMLVIVWCVIALTGVWQYAPPAWIAFAWIAQAPRRTCGIDEPKVA
jgi:O-antigen ligase